MSLTKRTYSGLMSTLTMTGSVTNATTKLTIVYQATNSLWGVEGTITDYISTVTYLMRFMDFHGKIGGYVP